MGVFGQAPAQNRAKAGVRANFAVGSSFSGLCPAEIVVFPRMEN